MAEKRFIESYVHGLSNTQRILVDTETGVNYLLASSSSTPGCGLTVLVDKEGKPIVTPIDSANQ